MPRKITGDAQRFYWAPREITGGYSYSSGMGQDGLCYNAAVEQFNGTIRKIPYSITNSLILHLERKEYFKAESGAQKAPEVKF
ncbi:MAG: LemA family protein [Desulfobacteraceae bacterium]